MHCSGTPSILYHRPPLPIHSGMPPLEPIKCFLPTRQRVNVAAQDNRTPTRTHRNATHVVRSCCIRRMILLAAGWLAWDVIEEGAGGKGLKLWSLSTWPRLWPKSTFEFILLFKYNFFFCRPDSGGKLIILIINITFLLPD